MGTRLFGVLGWPIGHSASPAMMKAAFKALSEDGVYLPFAVRPEGFTDAIRGLRALGAVGVNVTIPHKQAAWKLMDELTSAAELAQAVNTIAFTEDERFLGHNTDVEGWWQTVEPHLGTQLEKALIFGNGGAARAVLTALYLYRPTVKVQVVGRDTNKVQRLLDSFTDKLDVAPLPWEKRHEACAEADLVVNTTPIGMWPHDGESAVDDAQCFSVGQIVQDVVYRPQMTHFLHQAQTRGAVTVGGLSMLVGQGAAALKFWTGRDAPFQEMMDAGEKFLQDAGPL